MAFLGAALQMMFKSLWGACLLFSLLVVADGQFELAHAALQIKQVLVQVSLLGLQRLDRVLGALVLRLLHCVLVLQRFVAGLHLGNQRGANLVGLACERLLELNLLLAELSDLILVEVQLLSEDMDGLLKAVNLTLEGGSVNSGLGEAEVSLGVDDADVGVDSLLGHFNFNLFLRFPN